MIYLETERLYMRNLHPEDAEIMFDYRNDDRCSRYQRGQTRDFEGIRQLVEKRCNDEITQDKNFVVAVVLKETEEMVGEIVVMPNDGCFTLGYTFHYAHHRRGYAYEALHALADFLHSEYSDMEFICFTDPQNIASKALLQKLGYRDLGYEPRVDSCVFGKWLKDNPC